MPVVIALKLMLVNTCLAVTGIIRYNPPILRETPKEFICRFRVLFLCLVSPICERRVLSCGVGPGCSPSGSRDKSLD